MDKQLNQAKRDLQHLRSESAMMRSELDAERQDLVVIKKVLGRKFRSLAGVDIDMDEADLKEILAHFDGSKKEEVLKYLEANQQLQALQTKLDAQEARFIRHTIRAHDAYSELIQAERSYNASHKRDRNSMTGIVAASAILGLAYIIYLWTGSPFPSVGLAIVLTFSGAAVVGLIRKIFNVPEQSAQSRDSSRKSAEDERG